MKLLYFLLFVFALLFGGYYILNDYSFDNAGFSTYLISTLLIVLLTSITVAALLFFIALKRKKSTRNVMTIRQYYQYRDIR